MQTVELQCGHCQQVMAISTDHLGMQVGCPHCQTVIQVPDAAAFGLAGPTPAPGNLPSSFPPPPIMEREEESIFASSQPPADSLFHDSPPASPFSASPAPPDPFSDGGHEDDAPHEESAPLPLKPRAKASMLIPTVFIFLIPYSLASTGFTAWLFLTQQKNTVDPILLASDPRNPEGNRITHDLKLPAHLKTPLGTPLQVGDLEVTPLKVTRTSNGDWVLHLKFQNLGDQDLRPISESFCQILPTTTNRRPYTFLESLEGGDRLYGGYLQWLQMDGINPVENGVISPRQQMLTLLTTRKEDRRFAAALGQNPQGMLWRVQVRRGLVDTRDGPKSATAVIGVQFNSRDVQ